MLTLNIQSFFLGAIMINFAFSGNTTLSKFILDTARCKIPELHQWDLKKYYNPKPYIPCGSSMPLVKLEKIDDRYFVVLNPTIFKYYSNSSVEVSCWISNITRGVAAEIPDNEIKESRAVPFESRTKAEVTNDVTKVKCYKIQKNEAKVLFENVYGAYVPFNIIERPRPILRQPFNVLMVGVDSLSKYSFIKMMPKTYDYITQKGFKLIHGYSQLDRVALPNIIPLLSGYSMARAIAKFGSPLDTFFDIYNLVWYDYEKYGYVTAFAEDFAQINTFNRQYKGFWSRPTTFYFRPLTLAADLLNVTILDNMPHCTGSESGAERILQLALDFVVTFKYRAYFGLFWLNSFSHDDYSAPSRMDSKMKEFFENLSPHWNNTIVIFFSDHGYSKDSVTEEPIGLYESISPFSFVYLPLTFQAKYAEMTKKFEENSKNIVSPYDMYATLQDILVLSEANHFPKKSKSCPKCKSLFREMAKVRTCRDAGIDDDWCICWNEGMLRSPSNMGGDTSNKNDAENDEGAESGAIGFDGGRVYILLMLLYTLGYFLKV